ncbi:MAG: YigZ family protein [Calditrichaeota bacterium]|nr:YigZ family protein [Calditrichota bacterium]
MARDKLTSPAADAYRTVAGYAEHQIRVKGSRFVGQVQPVTSRAEAEAFLAEVQRRFHDATHHCYAYRLGCGAQVLVRSSDAGEPSGTAGKPILDALEGRCLTNLILVVTRYFGGTKLGMGGLARAYGQCAAETLERAGVVERFLTRTFTVSCPYDLESAVEQVVRKVQGRVHAVDYGQQVNLVVAVRQSLAEEFLRRVAAATSGKATAREE